MSSAAVRRSSYHFDIEHRLSVKASAAAPVAKADGKQGTGENAALQQQQQPSPLVRKNKRALEEEDDNNQAEEDEVEEEKEEEQEDDEADIIFDRLPAKQPVASTFKLVLARPIQHEEVVEQAPISEVDRLRQENATLRLKLTQLGNQYEAQTKLLQEQLAQVESARQQYELNVKQQFLALEQRAIDASDRATRLERQLEELKPRQPSPPSTNCEVSPKLTPVLEPSLNISVVATPPPRRGNGSPIPYGKQFGRGGVRPFAWRETTPKAPKVLAPPPKAPINSKNGVNTYRCRDLGRQRSAVAPLPARYIPVEPRFQEEVAIDTRGSIKTTASPTSTTVVAISETSESTSPPVMKVMPAWMAELQIERQKNTLSPEDYTVINIGC